MVTLGHSGSYLLTLSPNNIKTMVFQSQRYAGSQLEQSTLSEVISDPEVLLSPILVDQWKAWMADQMTEAGVDYGRNVYIGLRMDGRVRASGKGLPPWKKFIAELTPKEGIWSSDFMKGFDGRV